MSTLPLSVETWEGDFGVGEVAGPDCGGHGLRLSGWGLPRCGEALWCGFKKGRLGQFVKNAKACAWEVALHPSNKSFDPQMLWDLRPICCAMKLQTWSEVLSIVVSPLNWW